MGDRQRQSKIMPSFADPQAALKLARPIAAVDTALVVKQPTLLSAIKLCISLGGFQCDKELYRELDIDAGHWSRILRGEAHFPVDKLGDLMDLCGNEAPLIWLVHYRGYDPGLLRKYETELEKQLREQRERADRAESELAVAMKLIGGARLAA